jgi:nucleoside-diphosphate-sugar epimerase
VGLLGNIQTIGQTFHITSDEVKTWDQYLKCIGNAIGVEPKIIHIASDCIVKYFPEIKGGLLGDTSNSYVVDNSKIKRFVPGYLATMNFENGIRQTIEYFKDHPAYMKIDEEFDAKMDKFITAYENFVESLPNLM